MTERTDAFLRKARQASEPLLVSILALACWEAASRTGIVSPLDFPPVSVISASLLNDLGNPNLWSGIATTMAAWALGLALVLAIATPLGLLLGSSETLYRATHLLMEFVRTIPSVAALPLLIFLYGVGFQLTLMLVVLTAIWPLLIQVMYGVHNVDPVAIDTGRIYGLSRRQIFSHIVLPSASPYIATGVRLSGTIALVFAVATSLIAGGDGLGGLIETAAESAQTPLMYARILIAGLLGIAVTAALNAIERRALHWHPSQTRGRS